MNLDFQNNFFGWKETKIPMNSINCKMQSKIVKILRMQQIELRKYKIPKTKREI